jgi:hypothetical protein
VREAVGGDDLAGEPGDVVGVEGLGLGLAHRMPPEAGDDLAGSWPSGKIG